ncbi:MAG: phenylalanine--tRNA ligase subunit beta [Lachnospiraceae bacterium]|nr:phenylalanine--tRNA ligase subunit beta [Lachnospiraceae bacterium]
MNTTLSWVKAYVPDLDVTAQEYTDAMTLSGTKVEGYVAADRDLDKIVIGQIEQIEQHPDADKLIVCQVNVGEKTVQIVTGAPNVHVGDKIPVVLDGGRVAGNHDGKMTEGGIEIKKGKLRGIESNGMMCSIEELGSTRDLYPEAPEYGIYIFPEDAEVGSDAVKALGLDDVTFEYEITSNRVDCFSVIGIAREAAATFGKEFHPPVVTETPSRPAKENDETDSRKQASDYVKVTVQDPDLCSRYTARIVKNIRIAPSPKWMQRRLAAAGIRPINNIVDITNYVMEEYGQPMHAYDYDTIAGHEIIVRRAAKDEKFTTLDGQERTMDENVVMICDGEKSVGIGGIMGGENSMITDDVKTMMFEAACFDGTNIRLSSKRIGLRTDASSIFEKGLDPNNAKAAIDRACQLVEEMDAGDVVPGMVDIYPVVKEPVRIPFEPENINALLGTDISAEQMLAYFKKIDLEYDAAANEVIAPTFRQDLFRTADLAEEVARFYGYDNIPMTLPSGEATTGKRSFEMRVRDVAQEVAEFCGFSQGMSYSFESPKVFDKLLLPEDSPLRQAIKITNPLGEDYSIMRTTPLNGMLTSLAFNYNHGNRNVRLYELGNIYLPKALPLTELPDERMQLTLGMYGEGDASTKDGEGNFFVMKGVVEEFLEKAGLSGRVTYDPASDRPYLHPCRQADIIYNKKKLGYLGQIHPTVANDSYGIGERVFVAVLDMQEVTSFASFDYKYTGIARYPAATRDISMLVPKKVLAGQIEAMILQRGGKILESCSLFDVYEGKQIPKGYKSMAYSLAFRAKDRTLGENDITAAMKKIWNGLESLGIEIRS